MNKTLGVLFLLGLCVALQPVESQVLKAVSVLRPSDSNGALIASNVNGTIYFEFDYTTGLVTISGTLYNLQPSTSHALRINQYYDYSNTNFYNPTSSQSYSCYPTIDRIAGALGNVLANADGSLPTTFSFQRDLLSLNGSDSIIGRAMRVHVGQFNCANLNEIGDQVAYGVIGIANANNNEAFNAPSTAPNSVVAYLTPTALGTGIQGTVRFTTTSNGRMYVDATISSLAPLSIHGFHIHTYGDASDTKAALSSGSHYNPYNKNHGFPTTSERHYGDLGNIQANSYGYVHLSTSFDILQLTGTNNIIGRAVLIHSSPDDGVTAPTGNAGGRLAIGVIGVSDNRVDIPSKCPVQKAVSVIRPFSAVNVNYTINGTVTFECDPSNGLITISGSLYNLQSGQTYGLMLHERADFVHISSLLDIIAGSGGPYNPTASQAYNCYPSSDRVAGNLGNITATATVDTATTFSFQRDLISLNGSDSIIGRSIMIHIGGYNCIDMTAIAAPIAYGVIGVASATGNKAYNPASPVAPVSAIAVFNPTSKGQGISGYVRFAMTSEGMYVMGHIQGLNVSSFHGFHIHEFGDDTDMMAATSAGSHYNPYNKNHSYPTTTNRHYGDLGNIQADADGHVHVDATFDILQISGLNNIIGRALIIHAAQDDGVTVPSAGVRQAIAIIGISNEEVVDPDSHDHGAASSISHTRLTCFILSVVSSILIVFIH